MMNHAIYSRLMQHMAEAVCMTDENGIAIYANPKLCELLEKDESEIIGKPAVNFLGPKSKRLVEQIDATERQEGQSSSYAITLISKSKQRIPVTLNGTPLPEGGTIGIMTDMRRIDRQEQIYRNLIEHMDEAVCMTDADENATYANPKLCNLLGMKSSEIVGKPANNFLDEASQKKVKHVNERERKK